MRIGRWLYHHAPHIEQSPVFQVKKAAVRVTAWLPDGLTPAIQILVGDNPVAPNAYWVDMRMNGQEVRLGNDYATQVVIANSGWYRVEPDDLGSFGPALIWAEDEEGSMDDKIVPVHVVRTGCGGDGGGPTPPPIATQYVTCATLNNLIAANALIPSAWYGVIDAQPNLTPGQIVFVQAVDTDRVSGTAQFWAPWLSSGKLWPAKVNTSSTCQLDELHDPDRNVLIRGYYAILTFGAAWAPTYGVRNVTIIDGRVTMDASSLLEDAHIVGARISLFQSEVRQLHAVGGTTFFEASTVTNAVLEQPSNVRTVRTTVNGLYVGFNSNCYLNELGSVTAPHSPQDTRNIRVEDSSSLSLLKGPYSDVFAASNITVRGQSSFQAQFVNGPEGDGYLGNITVEGGAHCYFRDFQFIKNCVFRGGYSTTFSAGAIQPNVTSFQISECTFENSYLYIYAPVEYMSLFRVQTYGGYFYVRRSNFMARQITVNNASFILQDVGVFGPNVQFERLKIESGGQFYLYWNGSVDNISVAQCRFSDNGRINLRGNLQNVTINNCRVMTQGFMFLSECQVASVCNVLRCAVVDGGTYTLNNVYGYTWHEGVYVAGRGSFTTSVAGSHASSTLVSFRIYGGNAFIKADCVTDAGDVYVTQYCVARYNTFGNNTARFRYHKWLGTGSWTFNIDTTASDIFVYGHFAAGVQSTPYVNTFTTNSIRPEIRNF